LVLDNLEHLLDGVSWLATILDSAPGVQMLVTSRERLDLKAEWAFELHGVPVPAAAAATESGEAPSEKNSSAVALFVQSARRAQAGGDLSSRPTGPRWRRSAGWWLACRWPSSWLPDGYTCCRAPRLLTS
jgi:predicted ATPase